MAYRCDCIGNLLYYGPIEVTFNLSMRSLTRLEGVHPDLAALAEKAIHLTTVDFGILQGLRTKEQQEENVRNGSSQTMDSRHLTGHAIDVVAYEKGKVVWESFSYVPIADAFRRASEQLKIPVRYGGCWTVLDHEKSAKQQVEEYFDRCKKSGKRPFCDWGHFELPKSAYP